MPRERFFTCTDERVSQRSSMKPVKPKRPFFNPLVKRLNNNGRKAESMIKVRCDYGKRDKMINGRIQGSTDIKEMSSVTKKRKLKDRTSEEQDGEKSEGNQVKSKGFELEDVFEGVDEIEKSPENKKRKKNIENQIDENEMHDLPVWQEEDVEIWDKHLRELKGKSLNPLMKVCIDCSEKYCEESNSNSKVKCIICKESEHGCMTNKLGTISKGYIWICKE